MPAEGETLSLVVGKEIQQAKKIPTNAPGRGDYRREERLTHTLCRVRYLSIFSSRPRPDICQSPVPDAHRIKTKNAQAGRVTGSCFIGVRNFFTTQGSLKRKFYY